MFVFDSFAIDSHSRQFRCATHFARMHAIHDSNRFHTSRFVAATFAYHNPESFTVLF
jgi:hypothetical protein